MTRSNARIIGASMLAVGVLLLCALPLIAQENNTYIQHASPVCGFSANERTG